VFCAAALSQKCGVKCNHWSIEKNKDHLIGGIQATAQDQADLVEYLKSLTDNEVTHDP